MTDLIDLARFARDALACATSATLLVQGLGRVGEDDPAITVCEDDGAPLFFCEPGSVVTEAARNGLSGLFSVDSSRAGSPYVVTLAGPLSVTGVRQVDGVEVDVVTLTPERVLLESEPVDAVPVVQYEIPLDLYRRPGSDPMELAAASLMQHTNADHRGELRQVVAARRGLLVTDVVDAQLVSVEAGHAHVGWVDVDGSWSARVGFGRTATTAAELGNLLRFALYGGGDWAGCFRR